MGCIIARKANVLPAEDDPPATTQDIMDLFAGSANTKGQDYESAEKIAKLQLSIDEVKHILDIFNTINITNESYIDIEIFCQFFKVEKSQFAKRCFKMIDQDSSGNIDFSEFILSIWNYCTFDMGSLILFGFNFYDLDGSGALTMAEIKELIKEVYGTNDYETNEELQQEIQEADENNDGKLSFDEFKQWVIKSPIVLYPAFHMQQVLRRKVLGNKFWQRKRDQRIVWGNRAGKGLTIYDIIGDDEMIVTQMSNSKESFAKQMENWNSKNPNSNLTGGKKDKSGKRRKRTTMALVPDQMKNATLQHSQQQQQRQVGNMMAPITEDEDDDNENNNNNDMDDDINTKNKNITKELEKLDEEIEKNDKILSKDEALKKVEEEMDL